MKEKLYTIPLMDAFAADDECPLCFIERKLEQDALDFILGSAYMESDIREQTDEHGFCRIHFKKMYDYGNALGNALMLKTHYQKLNRQLKEKMSTYTPGKTSLKMRLKKSVPQSEYASSLSAWLSAKEEDCYLCNHIKNNYRRYLDTFFHLVKHDEEFMNLIKASKGFCLHHFAELAEGAEIQLSDKQKSVFFSVLFSLMETEMKRLEEDVSWFVDKYDYRNKDADWKNSRDAIPRGMQKLAGGYPADAPHRTK